MRQYLGGLGVSSSQHHSDADSACDVSQRTAEFVRLLTQHEPRVYGYILSLVPNWADADEILQETNVRLWEQYGEFKPGADFGAWACTIAHFQILTFRKREQRRKRQFSPQFVDLVAQEFAAQSQVADERLQALEMCLQTLSPQQRQLLEGCYSGSVSIKKLAEQLGRSIPGTYKALARIRELVHECIQRRMSGEVDA
jgi:RNA polymerase sigma-70 factor (ECF subfamily)